MLEVLVLAAAVWSCDTERVIEEHPELCIQEGTQSLEERWQWQSRLT